MIELVCCSLDKDVFISFKSCRCGPPKDAIALSIVIPDGSSCIEENAPHPVPFECWDYRSSTTNW
jgi:hypothetical protein